jgi:hypothetical protein
VQRNFDTQLVNAGWDLDQATSLGIMPANDPADGCVNSAIQQLGLASAAPGAAPAPPASFVPRTTGALDTAVTFYIAAQQLQSLGTPGTLNFSVPCRAVIGDIMLELMQAGLALPPAVLHAAAGAGIAVH